MPFGIPPSDPRIRAAGDYCDSTAEQLHQLIVDIVTPVALTAEQIENGVADIEKCVLKHYVKLAKGFDKGNGKVVDHITQTLGYVAQGIEQALLAFQDEATQPIIFEGEPEAPDAPPVRAPKGEVGGELTPEEIAALGPKYVGPKLGEGGKPTYEKLVVPDLPHIQTSFPCKKAPDLLTGLGAPVGSAVWCKAIEDTLNWFDALGTLIVDWIQKKADPASWEEWVNSWHPPDDWSSWVKALVESLKTALIMVLKLGARTLNTIIDIVRCAWYYTQTLTPMKRPTSYLAILFIRNILKTVDKTIIGSQTYLGFTLGVEFTIPVLQDTLNTVEAYLMPLEVPSIEWVIPAWLRGFITDRGQLECLLRVNGMNPNNWMNYLMARGETLTPEQAIQYARRHGVTQEEQLRWLRSLGFVDDDLAKARLELYDELPSIQDHLLWQRRNVFDDEYVKRYGLLAGFKEAFWPKFRKQLYAQGYTEERAALDYAAHWVRASPTQMLEWVYRLRPDKPDVTAPFTLEDFEKILIEQDYTAYDRERFAATAYKVPALTYLRDMHRMGLLSDDDMRSYHRDLGYKERDSDLFVKVDSYRRARMRATQGSGWSPAALRKAYAVGQIDADFVHSRMGRMGYELEDATDLIQRAQSDLQYRVISRSISTQLSTSVRQVREALRVGIMSEDSAATALTNLGFGADRSRGIASLEIASANTQRVKAAIGRVRHAFTNGEVNAEYAAQALAALGVVPDAVRSYLAVWRVEITPNRRRATAMQIVAAVRDGLMDSSEATARLENLQYSQADTLLFLADAAQQTVTTQQALQELDKLGGKAQGAQLAELGHYTIGLSRKIVARLKQQEPPSKLVKWLQAGTVDAGYVRNRLRLYDWEDSAIDKWIEEAIGNETAEARAPEGNGEGKPGPMGR